MLLRIAALIVVVFVPLVGQAQERAPVSQCQAIAEALPHVTFASFAPVAYQAPEVAITFVGHSTFLIETPGGVRIATDYAGAVIPGGPPYVATMNKAHESHFTMLPDPAIDYVLHGWGDAPGLPAEHNLFVDDVLIRNVTTDIRAFGSFEADGNSIFIFEVAGLCIGHLGHLHHELTDGHIARIGRLDVVMVPVDGGLTLGPQSMSNVIERLHSSIVLPMHRTGAQVRAFAGLFQGQYEVVYSEQPTLRVSLKTLPKTPEILLLKGVW
ncbi:MBL fold metallo-hydrolase [Martelella alba]|uniref:MBL fold metallo-hydrolase n=1 Tax=Martelella alba TaxID=2590451 RepID=A0A506UED9_9HYPH|nr:MBL fold metallo-hydrolase [Martelella alba]